MDKQTLSTVYQECMLYREDQMAKDKQKTPHKHGLDFTSIQTQKAMKSLFVV
jgi:hypothetical protein